MESSFLVNASPQLEKNLDENLLETLWASVDYTEMSQSIRPLGPIDSISPPSFNSLLSLELTEGQAFDANRFLPAPVVNLDSGSAYTNSMFDSMSPMTSFLDSNSNMDFNC
jgi:hypothetical protein